MSPREHPQPDALLRFMRAESPRAEACAVVRHLLTRCPQCLQVTRQLWRLGEEALLKRRKGRVPALEAGRAGSESGDLDMEAFRQ
ncbi:MAG: hypothetical protein JF614_13285 [Acidobacteria bacterium]|nr:hypothetical protein [Acidobacteriota bacterium]